MLRGEVLAEDRTNLWVDVLRLRPRICLVAGFSRQLNAEQLGQL